jgi:hypothetical protein
MAKNYKFKGYFANNKSIEVYAISVADAFWMIKGNSIAHWESDVVLIENTYNGKKYKPIITFSYEEV